MNEISLEDYQMGKDDGRIIVPLADVDKVTRSGEFWVLHKGKLTRAYAFNVDEVAFNIYEPKDFIKPALNWGETPAEIIIEKESK
jgi:hypothetical protein